MDILFYKGFSYKDMLKWNFKILLQLKIYMKFLFEKKINCAGKSSLTAFGQVTECFYFPFIFNLTVPVLFLAETSNLGIF